MLLEYTDKTSGVTDEELLSDLQDTSKEIGKNLLRLRSTKSTDTIVRLQLQIILELGTML